MRCLAFALCLASSCAHAQELTVVCKYEYSIDDQAKRGPTAGQFSMRAVYMLPIGERLNVQMRTTKAPCTNFLATGDDMTIQGGCKKEMQSNLTVSHVFKFDRVSGAFEEWVRYNDKLGLIHYGACVPAKPVL